ncbi:MAG TPA: 16S rRNA (adenine(1518)-N(6)/adenine(1519)-N(6))-dimethyltransferase RsmA [Candidatus Marinimicrobia bacterium]|nr:16S rRNA (adenine(1518)-N(6)/adenine(1519)-N(6))-dimethyltransferase RsmA [Candidatus Neomarinimicrobiota bacterium]
MAHPFRKKWGQNFLVDNNLLDKIVSTVDPQVNDHILEIGPGEGVLSEKILPQVKEMLAIEIDPLLVDHLNKQKNLKQLNVIQGDILVNNIRDLPITNPVRVIGNIPYNITSPIIFWLIEQLDYWDDAFVMTQKEVAQRLTAKVSTKAYGRLTVVVGAYLNVDYRFTIPPDVFVPKPKVDSAFIRLTKKKQSLIKDEDYVKFTKIVAAAFNQRRKMLRNSMKSWDFSKSVKEKIDFSRRPESLSVEEFALLVK